jgi:hypothetical protein
VILVQEHNLCVVPTNNTKILRNSLQDSSAHKCDQDALCPSHLLSSSAEIGAFVETGTVGTVALDVAFAG